MLLAAGKDSGKGEEDGEKQVLAEEMRSWRTRTTRDHSGKHERGCEGKGKCGCSDKECARRGSWHGFGFWNTKSLAKRDGAEKRDQEHEFNAEEQECGDSKRTRRLLDGTTPRAHHCRHCEKDVWESDELRTSWLPTENTGMKSVFLVDFLRCSLQKGLRSPGYHADGVCSDAARDDACDSAADQIPIAGITPCEKFRFEGSRSRCLASSHRCWRRGRKILSLDRAGSFGEEDPKLSLRSWKSEGTQSEYKSAEDVARENLSGLKIQHGVAASSRSLVQKFNTRGRNLIRKATHIRFRESKQLHVRNWRLNVGVLLVLHAVRCCQTVLSTTPNQEHAKPENSGAAKEPARNEDALLEDDSTSAAGRSASEASQGAAEGSTTLHLGEQPEATRGAVLSFSQEGRNFVQAQVCDAVQADTKTLQILKDLLDQHQSGGSSSEGESSVESSSADEKSKTGPLVEYLQKKLVEAPGGTKSGKGCIKAGTVARSLERLLCQEESNKGQVGNAQRSTITSKFCLNELDAKKKENQNPRTEDELATSRQRKWFEALLKFRGGQREAEAQLRNSWHEIFGGRSGETHHIDEHSGSESESDENSDSKPNWKRVVTEFNKAEVQHIESRCNIIPEVQEPQCKHIYRRAFDQRFLFKNRGGGRRQWNRVEIQARAAPDARVSNHGGNIDKNAAAAKPFLVVSVRSRSFGPGRIAQHHWVRILAFKDIQDPNPKALYTSFGGYGMSCELAELDPSSIPALQRANEDEQEMLPPFCRVAHLEVTTGKDGKCFGRDLRQCGDRAEGKYLKLTEEVLEDFTSEDEGEAFLLSARKAMSRFVENINWSFRLYDEEEKEDEEEFEENEQVEVQDQDHSESATRSYKTARNEFFQQLETSWGLEHVLEDNQEELLQKIFDAFLLDRNNPRMFDVDGRILFRRGSSKLQTISESVVPGLTLDDALVVLHFAYRTFFRTGYSAAGESGSNPSQIEQYMDSAASPKNCQSYALFLFNFFFDDSVCRAQAQAARFPYESLEGKFFVFDTRQKGMRHKFERFWSDISYWQGNLFYNDEPRCHLYQVASPDRGEGSAVVEFPATIPLRIHQQKDAEEAESARLLGESSTSPEIRGRRNARRRNEQSQEMHGKTKSEAETAFDPQGALEFVPTSELAETSRAPPAPTSPVQDVREQLASSTLELSAAHADSQDSVTRSSAEAFQSPQHPTSSTTASKRSTATSPTASEISSQGDLNDHGALESSSVDAGVVEDSNSFRPNLRQETSDGVGRAKEHHYTADTGYLDFPRGAAAFLQECTQGFDRGGLVFILALFGFAVFCCVLSSLRRCVCALVERCTGGRIDIYLGENWFAPGKEGQQLLPTQNEPAAARTSREYYGAAGNTANTSTSRCTRSYAAKCVKRGATESSSQDDMPNAQTSRAASDHEEDGFP
ncbi:unnamed protein product [Amoebophrya sp. A120]|nr:unnamed protein product [Amoebophrya sp. A120]|eukprot:GSA120T00002840001.1